MSNHAEAQDSGYDTLSFNLTKKIQGKFVEISCDNTGNLYAVNTTGRLTKYNANGDSVAAFNDVIRYGTPSQLDASNPLRPLLFYRNYSIIIILDQLLTRRYMTDLRKKGFPQSGAVCNSYDNKIWIYDNLNFKVVKLDEDLNLLNESADLRTLTEEAPEPVFFAETGNNLVLYDTARGFFIFDLYGGLKNNIPIKGWKHVGGSNDFLWGVNKGYLQFLSLQQHADLQRIPKYKLPLFISEAKSICITKRKLFLINDSGIEIYDHAETEKKLR
jgi:hypothetical protein